MLLLEEHISYAFGRKCSIITQQIKEFLSRMSLDIDVIVLQLQMETI
jgi:hypothetical protein